VYKRQIINCVIKMADEAVILPKINEQFHINETKLITRIITTQIS